MSSRLLALAVVLMQVVPRAVKSLSLSAVSSAAVNRAIKPRVIFVLGGPGAGKGTQCEKLSNDYGMSHLSAGELLRQERLSGSPDGELIESFIKNGQIVPVRVTLNLLRKALEASSCSRFLVDGFPRNADNLAGWEATMTGVCDVETMILIEVCEQELERRVISRGKTSGRSDDNIEAAKKRFSTYRDVTLPVVSHFERADKLVRVRGEGSIDDVYSEMCAAVTPLFSSELLRLNTALLTAEASLDLPMFTALTDPACTYVGPQTRNIPVCGVDTQMRFFSPSDRSPVYGRPSFMIDVSTAHT